MRYWLPALFVLMATTSFAMKITTINYDGLVHIDKAVADTMLGFKAGSDVDEESVNKALKAFFAQGYFKDIYVTEEAGVLTFHFTEKPTISKIEIEGYDLDEEANEFELLGIKKGSLYDEKKAETAKKRIIERISQEGKIDTIVEVQVEEFESGSLALKFIVNEGEEITIESLEYVGVEGIDPKEFDKVIANKEREFMGWFWGRNNGKLQLANIEYDPHRIRDYYMQNGYLDAKVEQPFVRIDFDHYTANMSYQVFEGDIFRVSGISFYQDKEVVAREELNASVKLQLNEPFNIQTFRDDAERIKTRIADLGYAYAQVTPDLQKNLEKKTVNVIYNIKPGKKVRIRNVVVAGNNRTLDRIVRRELYLGPGDMYNLTDLQDSRNALGRLGFFEGSTIEEKRIDDHYMDLIVKVKEAPTGNIQVGGGYGSYGGLLMNIAVSDRNIFGSGINVGLNLERSEMTENYSFNIANNRLNDSDFSGKFSIYTNRYEYNDYSVNSTGLSVGIGHRLSRHLSVYAGYGYAANSYEDVNTSQLSALGYVFFEDYAKSAVNVNFTFDNTDDYYLPRTGVAASQSFEKAGLGGNADFFKSRTSFNRYEGLDPLIGMDIIFRYKARYNYVAENGYLPMAERFFMGGIGSVRGYEPYSLSPTETESTGYKRRIGGTQTFSHNFELSFPLMPEAKLRLAAFLDWGWISDTDDLDYISRGSYGASVEWFSPVGPLQLVFAYPIESKDYDRTSPFEFTIGQRF